MKWYQRDPSAVFLATGLSEKMLLNSTCSSIFIQESMWYGKFNGKGMYSGVTMKFKRNLLAA